MFKLLTSESDAARKTHLLDNALFFLRYYTQKWEVLPLDFFSFFTFTAKANSDKKKDLFGFKCNHIYK